MICTRAWRTAHSTVSILSCDRDDMFLAAILEKFSFFKFYGAAIILVTFCCSTGARHCVRKALAKSQSESGFHFVVIIVCDRAASSFYYAVSKLDYGLLCSYIKCTLECRKLTTSCLILAGIKTKRIQLLVLRVPQQLFILKM